MDLVYGQLVRDTLARKQRRIKQQHSRLNHRHDEVPTNTSKSGTTNNGAPLALNDLKQHAHHTPSPTAHSPQTSANSQNDVAPKQRAGTTNLKLKVEPSFATEPEPPQNKPPFSPMARSQQPAMGNNNRPMSGLGRALRDSP